MLHIGRGGECVQCSSAAKRWETLGDTQPAYAPM